MASNRILLDIIPTWHLMLQVLFIGEQVQTCALNHTLCRDAAQTQLMLADFGIAINLSEERGVTRAGESCNEDTPACFTILGHHLWQCCTIHGILSHFCVLYISIGMTGIQYVIYVTCYLSYVQTAMYACTYATAIVLPALLQCTM